MIINFEEHTHELRPYEIKYLLTRVVNGLSTKVGKEKIITNKEMLKILKDQGLKITAPRLRKIINHIRVSGLVQNLISTSNGYYVATTKEEMENYIKSLKQRIGSITVVHDQMEYQLNKNFNN